MLFSKISNENEFEAKFYKRYIKQNLDQTSTIYGCLKVWKNSY